MSTSFLTVYKSNEVFKNDNRLKNKPSNQIYELYSRYLDFAIGEFSIDCYKNLDNINPFSQNEFLYISNGTDNIFSVPTKPDNCLFYVGTAIDSTSSYTEVTTDKYTYNDTDKTITITGSVLSIGTYVYISAYFIGEFLDDLNRQEINILNAGMLVPWDMEHLHRNSLLNQMVYGGNTKIYSQAMHQKSVEDVANNQYFKVFQNMISAYSYKYSPDKVKGLGGQV